MAAGAAGAGPAGGSATPPQRPLPPLWRGPGALRPPAAGPGRGGWGRGRGRGRPGEPPCEPRGAPGPAEAGAAPSSRRPQDEGLPGVPGPAGCPKPPRYQRGLVVGARRVNRAPAQLRQAWDPGRNLENRGTVPKHGLPLAPFRPWALGKQAPSTTKSKGRKTARQQDKAPAAAWERSPHRHPEHRAEPGAQGLLPDHLLHEGKKLGNGHAARAGSGTAVSAGRSGLRQHRLVDGARRASCGRGEMPVTQTERPFVRGCGAPSTLGTHTQHGPGTSKGTGRRRSREQ